MKTIFREWKDLVQVGEVRLRRELFNTLRFSRSH